MAQHIAKMRIQNGEYRHIHLFLLAKGSRGRANVHARPFYGEPSSIDETSYFFYCGEIATSIEGCTPISPEEFAVLSKFLSVV